jgi:hypothetical protein
MREVGTGKREAGSGKQERDAKWNGKLGVGAKKKQRKREPGSGKRKAGVQQKKI